MATGIDLGSDNQNMCALDWQGQLNFENSDLYLKIVIGF